MIAASSMIRDLRRSSERRQYERAGEFLYGIDMAQSSQVSYIRALLREYRDLLDQSRKNGGDNGMDIRIISFTDTGEALAQRFAEGLQGETMRCGQPLSLDEWTRQGFEMAEGLIYVGATGIAVRAIAPYVKSKTTDPAVVVVDETGRFAISLLSGHLGGANELTEQVAALCGAIPVITTATDRHGVFAVDSWARMQGCVVENPENIKEISSRLLAGETIRIRSDWMIAGGLPEGIVLTDGPDYDVHLSLQPDAQAVLRIIPQIAVLGIGCKKDISQEAIERVFKKVCTAAGTCEQAVCQVCSIDLKANEQGLIQFCEDHGWTLRTYSAEELRRVDGEFSASAFVQETVGVDNVCERSAVLGSDGGALYLRKYAEDGVTIAVALRPFEPNWIWR